MSARTPCASSKPDVHKNDRDFFAGCQIRDKQFKGAQRGAGSREYVPAGEFLLLAYV